MTVEEAIGQAVSGSSAAFAEIIAHARAGRLTDSHIGALALSLARSGERLLPRRGAKVADIASTGGAASLTTIICPIYLAALGCTVPKVGVPGRPAGGIDVLAQLPGFQYELAPADALRVLDVARYVHLLAGTTFAPADAAFFLHRREHNAVDIPELAIASLLAKKLCAGVSRAGMDVRLGVGGNFGASSDEARAHARRFVRIARNVDIALVCFLTGSSGPSQPYIGRGEALLALRKVLDGELDLWLNVHVDTCFAMAAAVASPANARPPRSMLREVTRAQLSAQGAHFDGLYERAAAIETAHSNTVTATQTGFLHIDLAMIRAAIVELQHEGVANGPFPDPSGVILKVPDGAFVERGAILATSRGFESHEMLRRLLTAFVVKPEPQRFAGVEVVSS